MKILIVSNRLSNFKELAGGAGKLGTSTSAFAVCTGEEASAIGADRVYCTQPDSSKRYDDYFDTLMSVVEAEQPEMIMISSTKQGKYMAASLAAALGTSTLTDLSDIAIENGAVKGTQMYYGGAAVKTVRSIGTAVVTVNQGSFDEDTSAAGEVINIPFAGSGTGIVCKGIRPKEGGSVNLAAAKKVIGVGRGLAKKDDIAMIEKLAVAIGAEVGCSRPIAEGEGWMTTDRYIGVSGVMLKPDVYIAVGISGQVQHIVGVHNAKTIIAINKDKNAPIFKHCDYGIVGDLYKIVPALTELMK